VRLTEAGATDEQMARIHGPIGLNIGASTPEEMAISILAEIIAVRHGRDAQPLTTATGNIRARV
jgi:xanthine dehydrogenase accessory factor